MDIKFEARFREVFDIDTIVSNPHGCENNNMEAPKCTQGS
jgi:hypothetical protein